MTRWVWVLAFLAQSAFAGMYYDRLTDDQKSTVQGGDLVTVETDMPDSAWPALDMYIQVAATADEVEGVVMDYETKPSYSESCKSAKISQRIDARTTRVDYVVPVPFIGDENFTLEEKLSSYDKDTSYQIDTHLIKSNHSKKMDGLLAAEPLGTGALLYIHTFVNPDSGFAGLVKGQFVSKTQDATTELARHVEDEKKNNLSLLQKEVVDLHAALSSK